MSFHSLFSLPFLLQLFLSPPICSSGTLHSYLVDMCTPLVGLLPLSFFKSKSHGHHFLQPLFMPNGFWLCCRTFAGTSLAETCCSMLHRRG
ncbi:hypothetical protein B0H19DRAFT_1182393 [Mycena capillaripes]|nr:hypothetical protein B0H19DRAFT_1182393 [Mycena capillaripes]